MSEWFHTLGRPLGAEERRNVSDYLSGLYLAHDLPIEGVSDWKSAHAAIVSPGWDRRWWDAEQREKDRLSSKARAVVDEPEFWRSLSASLESADGVYEAAAIGAARGGCEDMGLIRAAAGALSQALYLAELSRIAGEGTRHPFFIKKAVFASGHWPLGIVHGTYYVF
ncbi:MAG TPA: hypothetical protein VI197_17725 [Polyangiaceae bacterium]